MRIINGTTVFGEHEDATLGQIATVAKHAERTVLCADAHVGYVMPIGGVAAYRDKVSVVGVGFDIACLAAGTPVVTTDGYHLPIEQVRRLTPAACWDGARVRPVAPNFGAVARGVRATRALTLANGRALRVTEDHRVRTREGWRPAGTLRAGDVVACVPFVGVPHVGASGTLRLAAVDRAVADRLAEAGLWPVDVGAATFPALLRLLGYVNGDGHLTRDGQRVSVYTTDGQDAADVASDFAALGLTPRVYRRARGAGRLDEIHVAVNSRAFHALFAALGAPVGRKAWPAEPMPWLFELPAWARAQYLSAFASAEMMTPRVHANGVVPNLQLKQAGEDRHAIDFVARLLASLGFETSVAPSGASYGTRRVHVLQLLGGQAAQLRFVEQVGFCRARAKRVAAAWVAGVVWSRATHVATREEAKAAARALQGSGVPWRTVVGEVATQYGVPSRFAYHAIYDRRGEARHLPGVAVRADCDGEVCWVPVASVECGPDMPVYDVVTGDPAESFLAHGVVVHNCGNAAIRTDLTLASLGEGDAERRARLTNIADEIQSAVSFGVGRKNRADDAPVDDPLFGSPTWDAVPARERGALRDKARAQLGTVGSGNHYVDVFADEAGRLWVGVHFGSRGFGHTVASAFLALGQGKAWGERAPETEVLLDVRDPIGHDYWHLMNLAGRYAYAGREWVARKVVDILGGREVELVHNHHNFCVSGDASIATPQGPKPMRDVRAGDTVYAFDVERGLVPAPVTRQWQSGIRLTVTLRTSNRRISVTADHPVLVIEKTTGPHPERPWMARGTGILRWKSAGDVITGDILICARGYFAEGDGIGVDRARMVGAMLGDGWVRHEPTVQGYTVGLAIGDAGAGHTARYQELLEHVLPSARWRSNRRGAFGLTCSSVDVWREVVSLGLGGYSREKRVPRVAFQLPRHEKLALLAGYVDSDGSVAGPGTSNHGRTAFVSVNRGLIEDLRELAIACELRITPVRQEHVTTNFGPCTSYRCVLDADSTTQLELWHDTKRLNVRHTRYGRQEGLEAAKLGYLTLPDGVFAQRVRHVECSRVAEPVFDLTVDHPSHAFICDGVVVHNCWRETHDGDDFLVIRKGATPAFPGQKGFVGGSMGDDAVIIQGTPNAPADVAEAQRLALYSTVHGAGRVMSRTAAAGKRNRKTGQVLSPGRVTPEMMTSWVAEKGVVLRGGGLDESPHVYRRLPEVLAAQEGTIEVLHTLRPLVVVMAGANEFDPYKD